MTKPPRGGLPGARTPAGTGLPAAAARAARADGAFGADLLAALGAPGDNAVFSPASIAAALRMLLLGAGGETARQIAAALHLAGPEDAGPGLRLLAGGLAEVSGDGLTLRAPSTLWVQSGLPLREDFGRALADLAGAAVQDADFSRAAERARRDINTLIEQQTGGKIVDLLEPGALSPSTRLVLANAVYLKAAWAHEFPASATRDAPFRPRPGRKVTVPTMRVTARLGYARGDGHQTVVLPYLGGRLAMAIILPDGPLAPCERAAGGAGLDSLLTGISWQQVDLALPKFRQHTRLDLSTVLMRLGIVDAFSAAAADLGGITAAERLCVDKVVHMAHIAVDERGTEAAAATAVVARTAAAFGGVPVTVTVDRPFLFAITDTVTGLPLFLGRVTDPAAG